MCLTTHYQWFSFVSRSQTSFHIYLDLLVKLFYTRVGSVRSIFDSFSGVKSAAVRFFSFYFVRLNGCSLLCKTQKNACWNLGILSACIRNKTEWLHFYVRVVRKEESSHRNGKIGKKRPNSCTLSAGDGANNITNRPHSLLNRVWT